MSITGFVVDSRSHWTGDGSRIVTDFTIQTDAGDAVVVRQLGGTVDGIGMTTFPSLPPLALGMQVAVAAHEDLDLQHRLAGHLDHPDAIDGAAELVDDDLLAVGGLEGRVGLDPRAVVGPVAVDGDHVTFDRHGRSHRRHGRGHRHHEHGHRHHGHGHCLTTLARRVTRAHHDALRQTGACADRTIADR